MTFLDAAATAARTRDPFTATMSEMSKEVDLFNTSLSRSPVILLAKGTKETKV